MGDAYEEFLASKAPVPQVFGREPDELPSVFYPFQAAVTKWAIRRGRAALFLDTGLGKSICQLEWARQSGERVLIVTPLAVAEQTIAEAKNRLDLVVRKVAEPSGNPGIEITNYEKLHRFIGAPYDAIVLDESSILKNSDGATRTMLVEEFAHIPRRLCCSATPAPNDVVELTNHAEFLGVMTAQEMKATFFAHDSESSAGSGWRLKGHAHAAFWKWMAKWAAYVRKPSDLGFEDGAFQLPPLTVRDDVVTSDWKPAGMLFATGLGGITDRGEVRRLTLGKRAARAGEIIRAQWESTRQVTGKNTTPIIGSSDCSSPTPMALATAKNAASTIADGASATKRTSRRRTGTINSNGSTESISTISKSSPQSKTSDAQSAKESTGYPGSASTTTTEQAPSEDFSAMTATQGSACSAIATSASGRPSTISRENQWLVWVKLNAEEEAVKAALGDDAVAISGRDSDEEKLGKMWAWQRGDVAVLVTKPEIYSMGVNWQHCRHVMFVGLSDSYEAYYQAIRRCWRFGQKHPVDVVIVTSDAESAVAENVRRKEAEAAATAAGVAEQSREVLMQEVLGAESKKPDYRRDVAEGDGFKLLLGDCVDRIREVPDASIGLSVFSPPFSSLFTYSNSDRDMGNVKNDGEFFEHFKFLIPELMRITMPGRTVVVHCQDIVTTKTMHGYIGKRDFSGDIIRAFLKEGWIYDGRITIDKDPQAAAIRSKALMHGTPVLTPAGWKPIEAVKVGDRVIGASGTPTTVIDVSPQGERDLFKVTFTDGAEIVCDREHLWAVTSESMRQRGLPARVLTLGQIVDLGIRNSRGRHDHEIPLCGPVQFDPVSDSDLPIDPYLLGVLLGDGSFPRSGTVGVTTDHEIVAKLVLPDGLRPVLWEDKGPVGFYGFSGNGGTNPLHTAIRDLGLWATVGDDKFIPPRYLFSSLFARRALLQGLLDTDGMATTDGRVKYSTSSSRLRHDIEHLARSLGFIANTAVIDAPVYTYNGEKRAGQTAYVIAVRFAGDWCPFRLGRKAARWRPRKTIPHRCIDAIQPAGRGLATCIAVEAEDGLFVTDNFIVTHNSKQLLFVQKERDANWLMACLPDYMLRFRDPRENAVPVKNDVTNEEWIQWARPIWYGIKESETLNAAAARSEADEKHICALQLGTIERCVRLWTNEGETIFSPFAGIGSEGFVALRNMRKFVGIELKEAYWTQARRNLASAKKQLGLFMESP